MPMRARSRTSTCPPRDGDSDELVTQVIAVKNVNAAQLVPVLRPLMPQAAHMAAYPRGNILDPLGPRQQRGARHAHHRAHRPAGRQRSRHHRPAARLGHRSGARGQHVLPAAAGGRKAAALAGARHRRRPLEQRADRRRQVARLRIKALVAHLDTPLDNGGDTQVRYLQFADAEKIAAKLKEQISATVAITGGAPAAGGAAGERRRRQRGPLAPRSGPSPKPTRW